MSNSLLGPVKRNFMSFIVHVSSGPIFIMKHGLLDYLIVTSNYFSIGSNIRPGFLKINLNLVNHILFYLITLVY
jgi:hypothetical protein